MIANRESLESLETEGRSPGERDLQVFAAVRVDGRRQVDVAAEFGITQGRVSQIVRRVNRWRVGMGIAAELERRDRKSVDRWLEQLRIEKLYEETMELYRRSQQPRRKERRGTDHRGEWNTEAIDHQPGNLQCLKLAARLIELRRQLDEDPPRPDQSDSSPRSHMDEYEAFRFLVDLRSDAIRRGDAPEGEHPEVVVQRMMRELAGSACRAEPDGPRDAHTPADVPPGRRDLPTNEPAIINDISSAAADEPVAVSAASDAAGGVCAIEPIAACPAPEANNREVFLRDARAAQGLAPGCSGSQAEQGSESTGTNALTSLAGEVSPLPQSEAAYASVG